MRAAGAVLDAVDAWNGERAAAGADAIRIGIGIAVGPVVFGAVGDATRLEFTVIGDAVNLAAKLEKHTKAEKVRALTTATALESAREQGYDSPRPLEMRSKSSIDGIDEPVDLAVLGG